MDGDDRRLAGIGKAYLAQLGGGGAELVPQVRELPDGLGVCVFLPIRGGGTVLVARDESVLFVGSAMGFERGLAAFREGRRTPPERFRRPGGDPAP
ncbi:hypothetical protein [Streptomyces sp. CAU 1734]|uniref:hypothetical protein n=1 Tax=Streptomyces sp. CAU 1734 TaxID=3140360 RepID=UPI003260027E